MFKTATTATTNEKHWGSAYLRQGTSYQCRHLANQYEQQIYVR